MNHPSITPVAIRRFTGHAFTDTEDLLAIEEPLEIQILYGPAGNRIQKNISVTMRTPGHDEELAAGFLFTEGIIHDIAAIDNIQPATTHRNNILVHLSSTVMPDLKQSERNFFSASGCGVCGKTSMDSIHTLSAGKQVNDSLSLDASFFHALQDTLMQHQEVFGQTGGLHAAALFDLHGRLLQVREDVGRHNALDKLIGAALLDRQLPLPESILLLSGRAGFELVQKAAMAGIPVIAAVGAPSSMAVQLAAGCGITLIGFLRDQRFNIYSASKRIIQS